MGDLSPHFDSSEFRCHHCQKLPLGGMNKDLIQKLERLRLALGARPVTIVSGYRCPAHNKAVGGVKESQHVKGKAADVTVDGVAPVSVYQVAGKIFKGVGLYNVKGFVHVDVRLWRARWRS